MITPDYATLWPQVVIPASRLGEVEAQASAIIEHRADYEAVGGGVPWWFVGCLHWRESGGNFACHLHNGDPLTHRTVHAPAGRPASGSPPFTWVQSARDALMLEHLGPGDWSPPQALERAEIYNGTGYRTRGLRSPYVFGATTLQQPGKFTSDGRFSATTMDQQVGVAAMMWLLVGAGASVPAVVPETADDLMAAEMKTFID